MDETISQLDGQNSCLVLLVEDEPLIQKIHLSMLNELGCESMLAETGQQALTLADRFSYDVILLDIGLPDINGIEVAKKIRQTGNQCKIVALTAFMQKSIEDNCLTAGINIIETKPITLNKLKKLIGLSFH